MCDFYQQAADVIEQLIQKKGSIKGLTYNKNVNVKTSKTCYALVCETLKYKSIIDQIIENTPGLEKEFKNNKNIKYSLLVVMIYEMLFSNNEKIKGGGNAKKLVLHYRAPLNSALARMKIQKKVSENIDLLPDHIRNPITLPRYVRINTLFNNCNENVIQETIKYFQSVDGFELLSEPPKLIMKSITKDNGTIEEQPAIIIGEKQFYQDLDFPEILIFHHSVDLHDHKLLLNGNIILQDKASCLPSFILSPPLNSVCIDSCSAPGNKTSLLSAQMKNTGKVFAIEKDTKRLGTLIKLTNRSHCKNIETINDSFLNLKHDDPKFKDVEYILCDPSCSGSGIVNRLDYLLPTKYQGDEVVVDENDEDLDEIINQQGEKSTSSNNTKTTTTPTTPTLNKKELKKEKKRKLKEMKQEIGHNKFKKQKQIEQAASKTPLVPIKTKEQIEEEERLEEEKRVKLLADFQLSIIQHAFAFPNVKKVIYSTCSTHQIENEDVVERAIKELNKNGEKWRVVNILPHWKNSRGFSIYKNSEHSIRMTPSKDFTIGFFVSLFEKIDTTNNTTPTTTPKPTSTPTVSSSPVISKEIKKVQTQQPQQTKPNNNNNNTTKKQLPKNNNNNNNIKKVNLFNEKQEKEEEEEEKEVEESNNRQKKKIKRG